MSSLTVNPARSGASLRPEVTPQQSPRFSYYRIDPITKMMHPKWSCLIDKIYTLANLILRAANYLYSSVWKQPVKALESSPVLNTPTRDPETSFPLNTPLDAAINEAINNHGQKDLPAAYAEVVNNKVPSKEVGALPISASQLELLEQYTVSLLAHAYAQKIREQEHREPTQKELETTFSNQALQKIHTATEKMVCQLSPKELQQLKTLFEEAELAARGGAGSFSKTALIYGALTGFALTYMSTIVSAGITAGVFSGVGVCTKYFINSGSEKALSKVMTVLQGAALLRRGWKWGQMGYNALEPLSRFLSIKNVPKGLSDYLSMRDVKILQAGVVAGSAAAGAAGLYGLKRYVEDQDYAVSNEAVVCIRDRLKARIFSPLQNGFKSLCGADQNTAFEKAYSASSQATAVYLCVATLAGGWLAAPCALAAGIGTYYMTA